MLPAFLHELKSDADPMRNLISFIKYIFIE